MMKLMILSLSFLVLMKMFSLMIMTMSLSMILVIYMYISKNTLSINFLMMLDNLSMIMIILSIMSTILIILSSPTLIKITKTIIPIFMILMITFMLSNILYFYILFELVLIPTMLLILMNGKQPERLQAGIYLIIYTITASLPLLASIIILNNNMSFSICNTLQSKYNLIMFMTLAFLVKMPMYFTHLWLPKAHVEAPLEGSMILAAVLLKLGGYGLIRFIPICIKSINQMNYWIISISLMGATATSLNCIRQKDLKSLIAYSSVAHMGFVLTGIFASNFIGITGAITMMIAHGLASSALFLLVNELYMKYHSRNMPSFKGLISMIPNITFWWFMFMAVNISAPPSINTISEIFLMSSLMHWNINNIMMIFLLALMTASFSMSLYINISHNKNDMLPSIQSEQKIFTSLFLHLIPLILMLMKLETMMQYLSSLNKTMVCGTMFSMMSLITLFMTLLSLIPILMSIFMLSNNTFILMKLNMIYISLMNLSIDIMLDWISMMFLSTVMFISSMIIFFSKYYIPSKQQKQFIILLLMFILSMSILIISNNIFLILLGWDGLGLSSYILVIYYQNFQSAASGSITLLSNRIGDILILLSIGMLTMALNWNFNLNKEFMFLPMIMLTIAACSKSAQFPFSAWLPMAMAAPTPISALVHSSTLVTAGVFILIRIMNDIHPSTMIILMLISSATAIYSSMSANWEQDLKKIIALSTLSQIAMMMFAISMGSMILSFFHLIIHALFKSTMFLCAGIMIHESSYQDMRMMGMNNFSIPLAQSIMGITSMALIGLPFMSGFFSKDAIIENLISSNSKMLMSILMIFSIGMTASYSIRMLFFSSKTNNKFNPNSSNHSNFMCNIPILMLGSLSITTGSLMSWMMNPEQMFFMTIFHKILIITMLLLGLMVGLFMFYKSKIFMMLGQSSISLWFTHFISVTPMNKMSLMMDIYNNNDKTWQETYGPQNSFFNIKMMSLFPEMSKYFMMMIMIMLIMIPPLLIM